MKIKTYGIIAAGALVALVVMGCENGLTGGAHNDESTNVAALRSASLDPEQNCQIETAHVHDGITYSGHYNNDGHDHHNGELAADDICTVAACSITGTHRHGETYYGGHHGNDVHSGSGHHGGSGNCHA